MQREKLPLQRVFAGHSVNCKFLPPNLILFLLQTENPHPKNLIFTQISLSLPQPPYQFSFSTSKETSLFKEHEIGSLSLFINIKVTNLCLPLMIFGSIGIVEDVGYLGAW